MWVWHAWICRGCGAKLRLSSRHRLVIGLPIALTGSVVQMIGAAQHQIIFVVIGAVLVFGTVALIHLFDRVHIDSPGPFCTKCEYDPSAVEGAVCPECGSYLPRN